MPQDIEFELPFEPQINPGLEGCRRRNLDWVRSLGLVEQPEALNRYLSWDLPRLAAYGFPQLQGPDLDICADALTFFFLFDDQFDGPLGRAPDRVAQVCQDFIDIIHGAALPSDAAPCLAAFDDIWHRSTHGAPPGWTPRVTHEWEYYFAAHAHEALNRCAGVPASMEEYLQVRRGIGATNLPVSLGERAAGICIPLAAFHSPQLRIMREIVLDVTMMCNDVYSLEKEEAQGDMDNLVLVIEHEQRCSRNESVAAASHEIHRKSAHFLQLARAVPSMITRLGFTPQQRAAVERYVEMLTSWFTGYHAWETETLRYTKASKGVSIEVGIARL
ncbi:terpene synthase family protein [Streptomyces syringium]|uniref:terpene synthase family protein n=1 Tax=Streptomyces syringium TaxID=76729 RepID=UPI003AAEFEC9